MQKFQAIRGMNDLLPDALDDWQVVEALLRRCAASFAYREIRFPLLEYTGLFTRTIGEVTDIVEKEMYTFFDRNNEQIALRPEGTAGCIRAGIAHGLLYHQTQRFWYMGPMFRYEKPQKGRYRQFHQFGLEAFGFKGPDIDAEMLDFCAFLWRALGISEHMHLQINSLGSAQSRQRYRQLLQEYFSSHHHALDEESQRRLTRNPLRILDSKNPAMRDLIQAAPSMLDHLEPECADHFSGLQAALENRGIPFTVNPRLVRGLDYYGKTVFEWVTSALGAQDAVCAGGRYDDLVGYCGGKPTPAIGFALGLERLVLLYQQQTLPKKAPVDVYLIMDGEEASKTGPQLAGLLREKLPLLRLQLHCGDPALKKQLKRADQSGACFAVIVGEKSRADQTVSLKYLREDTPQAEYAWPELHTFFKNYLEKKDGSL